MNTPAKIRKLDDVVINRIAAGEVIQRPANALKELIENSLDAKANNIQITVKEGGLKLLQIQDNGTGIRKEDMEIVCERFTTSKLQKFEDLRTIATYGFRGEALASISHIALLTITTKTASEKCAYKASYIDSKLKAPLKACAGNQGTIITIENLFYNIATRRKALVNHAEEFTRITEVVTKYAVHNSAVGFTLKKHGDTVTQVRTVHSSTKMNNIRILYGNPVARELLEIEYKDDMYKFKVHALITNPNYSNKRMTFLLFINHRLVDSSSIRKMLENLYSIYLPKRTYPWCYLSLEINPNNIDVNVHPTKHEVKFLHEDSIIEKIKIALDEKLAGNSASKTFYMQARLPTVDITEKALKEILPEYDKESSEKSKMIQPCKLIRTDSSDQKLDKFNFISQAVMNRHKNSVLSSDRLVENKLNSERTSSSCEEIELEDKLNDTDYISKLSNIESFLEDCNLKRDIQETKESQREIEFEDLNPREIQIAPNMIQRPIEQSENWSTIVDETDNLSNSTINSPFPVELVTPVQIEEPKDILCTSNHNKQNILEITNDEKLYLSDKSSIRNKCNDSITNKTFEKVYQYLGNNENIYCAKNAIDKNNSETKTTESDNSDLRIIGEREENENEDEKEKPMTENTLIINEKQTIFAKNDTEEKMKPSSQEFKSHSVNTFRREVKLLSVLGLRKEVEDTYHEGLREILSNLIFVGCVDEAYALIQSGVNLYICNTQKLAEELFYEIMLYDFANYGVIKFSEPVSLHDLAMLGLEMDEAGWTEEDGDKEILADNAKELLLEKTNMLKEYFSIVIDEKGNLKSVPILLDKYFPCQAELPLYILRLATEVDWTTEQPCFRNICRETAKLFSRVSSNEGIHDWKHVTEHILYPAIKSSLLPPKHFAHDSTILQIANLPNLYKVFERC